MKIWRSSRNEGWNNHFVQTLLGWRMDKRRTQDYSEFAAWSLAKLSLDTFSACTTISVVQAVSPVIITLTRLEDAYGSLNYEAPARPFNMRAAEHAAFGSGSTKTYTIGEIL